MLHSALPNQIEDLRRQFASAQPFRHVVIDQFLDPAFCSRLMDDFPAFDAKNALNERGEPGRKAVISDLMRVSGAYARFDRLMRGREFLSLIGRITGIPDLLYDPDYIGGGTHENLNGQELDTHVDFNYHPTAHTHRRLNLIVFLNREWRESWGGCLELLRDPWATREEDRRVVLPLANRAVIFETTESSWHGFRRIQLPDGVELSRRSIAVYFYTKDRPEQQISPAHGTFYYQRPLPDHIRAGRTLREEDIEELQILLQRRDQHIQFLYNRELEFSKTIAAITASHAFRMGRILIWPARALRSIFNNRE